MKTAPNGTPDPMTHQNDTPAEPVAWARADRIAKLRTESFIDTRLWQWQLNSEYYIGLFTRTQLDAAVAAAVKAERERTMKQVDYAIDLQRIIEALCGNREIPVPASGARHHYDMAVAFRARAIRETANG